MNASHLLPDCEFFHEEVLAYKASLLGNFISTLHNMQNVYNYISVCFRVAEMLKKMPEKNPIRDCDRNKKRNQLNICI